MISPTTSTYRRNQMRKARNLGKPQIKEIKVERDEQTGEYLVPDWETYRLLVAETESIPELWSEASSTNLRTVHHILGVCSEIDELFDPTDGLAILQENWPEEIGDLLWYLASLDNVSRSQGWLNNIVEDLGLWTMANASKLQPPFIYRAVKKEQAELLDAAKRLLAYGDGSLQTSQINSLITRVSSLIALCASFPAVEVSIPEIAKLNIAKLRRRYKQGFDAQQAVNRRLSEEAAVFAEVNPSGMHERVSKLAATRPKGDGDDCRTCNDPWGKGRGNDGV